MKALVATLLTILQQHGNAIVSQSNDSIRIAFVSRDIAEPQMIDAAGDIIPNGEETT